MKLSKGTMHTSQLAHWWGNVNTLIIPPHELLHRRVPFVVTPLIALMRVFLPHLPLLRPTHYICKPVSPSSILFLSVSPTPLPSFPGTVPLYTVPWTSTISMCPLRWWSTVAVWLVTQAAAYSFDAMNET